MENLSANIDLTPLNSFGITATASNFFAFDSVSELSDFFFNNPDYKQNFKILAGGNNILLANETQPLILHPTGKNIVLEDKNIVYAQAGVDWDDLVLWSVEHKLWGLENLSIIPGTVGASPVQNIGAYGVEVKDCILSVEVFMVDTCSVINLSNEQCRFGYRDSIFKQELKGKAIITGVRFKLSLNPKPILDYAGLISTVNAKGEISQQNIRESVIEIRDGKLPDPKKLGNVGSFFKNPVIPKQQAEDLIKLYPNMPVYPTKDDATVKLAAGWLIDTAGWKGKRMGNVGVHDTQALVLINYSGATGKEILDFANKIIQDIDTKFGVKIEMEVNVW